ncbi:MAG TPA: hypothetical protein VHJ82_06015, partial [Actinomycetota bacterium]|nr:hypothetical protein [Actinomycetota bacterium]
LSQRIRRHSGDLFAQPGIEVIQIPPVCTEVGLRDFSKTSRLIDQAHEQTVRFLNHEHCLTCDHDEPVRQKGVKDGQGLTHADRLNNVA